MSTRKHYREGYPHSVWHLLSEYSDFPDLNLPHRDLIDLLFDEDYRVSVP